MKKLFLLLILLSAVSYAQLTKIARQADIHDSLAANSQGFTVRSDVNTLISDSLGANARSFTTLAVSKTLISDSLGANARSFTTLAVAKALISDSLKGADSIKTRALVIENGAEDVAITVAGSLSGGYGLNVGETVVVEEAAGGTPSVGFITDGNTSDIVPPGSMTGSWDWTLPDKSGTFMMTSDTASLSNRINTKVTLTGNETIAGVKTFSSSVIPAQDSLTGVDANNVNLDWSLGNSFIYELTDSTKFTMSNSVDGQQIVIAVQDSSSYVVTWTGDVTIVWSASTAPTQTTGTQAVPKVDIYSFIRLGDRIYGTVKANFY